MVPDLIVLALQYHRSPLRYRRLADPLKPLPKSFDTLVSVFGAALSAHNIEVMARELNTSAAEIEEAALFFIRQVLLCPGADYYRVLGLSRRAPDEAVRQHYQLLVRLFHPDRSSGDRECNAAYTARINDAYRRLRSPDVRRDYNRQLAAAGGGARQESDPREFLRPSQLVESFHVDTKPGPRLVARPRRVAALVLGALAVAMTALFLFRAINQPALRSNPNLADKARAAPSFLHGNRPRIPARGESNPDGVVRTSVTDTASNPPPGRVPDTTSEASAPPLTERAFGASSNRDWIRHAALTGRLDLPENLSALVDAAAVGDTVMTAVSPGGSAPPLIVASTLGDAARLEEDLVQNGAVGKTAKGVTIAAANNLMKTSPRDPPQPHNSDAESARRPAIGKQDDKSAADARARAEAADVVYQLTRFYRNGDLDGFVTLFMGNAQVTEGAGVAFIRADYADLFRRVPERHLDITNLSWQPTADDGMVGKGELSVSGRSQDGGRWDHATGTVQFELVRWKDSYKILKMIHRLK